MRTGLILSGFLLTAFIAVGVPAVASVEARASIGDAVDCASLTVRVTLENTQATDPTQYLVLAQQGNVTSTRTTIDVAAGGSNVMHLNLPDHGVSVVDVFDNGLHKGQPGYLLAEAGISVECGSTRTSAASATIGDLDCGTALVPVTLDNTGSAEPTTFDVQAMPFRTPDDPTFFDVERLPAGAKRIVQARMDALAPVLQVLDAGPFEETNADDVLLATRDVTRDFATCPVTAGVTLPHTGG